MVQPPWKRIRQFHIKLNIHLTYDQVILILGIYPGEIKNYVHKERVHKSLKCSIHNHQNLETTNILCGMNG